MYLDYKIPSARRSKLNILLAALKLPRMCLEVVFRICVYCGNLFYSTENAIIYTGTLKCPNGMVRYGAWPLVGKEGSYGRLDDSC